MNRFNSLGWILFLALAALVLVFYNLAYLPKENRIARLRQEVAMWTSQVQSLSDSLKLLETRPETLFSASYTWDELFTSTDSLRVAPLGEATLRELVPKLKDLPGIITITGHTDNRPVPEGLRTRYPSNWERAGAAAAAVARLLVTLGVPASRIVVASAAETRPVRDNASPEGRAANRRVEITVRSK